MKLYEFFGKNVVVHSKCGKVLSGKVRGYSSALDNPEGKSSIGIGYYEIFEDEIESIEEVKSKVTQTTEIRKSEP